MARLPYLDEPSDIAKPTYEDTARKAGRVLNPIRMIGHSPELLRDWWTMMMTLNTKLELNHHLRELILLRLFKITGFEYGFIEHVRISKRLDVPEQQISDIEEFETSDAFNECERLMLRYTEHVTRDQPVDDTLFNALREHFSDREMVEITFCIGNWNCVSKFALALQLDLEEPRETD
ncbi:MAG: hypothetical protein VCD00_19380 [Candidatus Hydrogenedentota bacterium]